MKKYITIYLLAILGTLTSCSDFLEEKAYSFISGDDLYKTESGIKLALDGLYNTMNAMNAQGEPIAMWEKYMQYMTNLGTDELINNAATYSAEPDMTPLAMYNYNTESKIISYVWFGHYLGIDRANNILANIDNVDMDANTKKCIIAETKFMRGFFQFYLAWMYGGVPAPRTPLEDANAPRLPLKQVYEFIIDDLKYAYQNMPERNSKVGRPNKYVAASMLSKVYIYLASYKQYNGEKDFNDLSINDLSWVNSEDMYTQAGILLKEVYTESGYELINPYGYLYYDSTEETARKESLFTVMASAGSENYLIMQRLWSVQGPTLNYGWIRPLNELVSKYSTADPRKARNITGNAAGSNVNFEKVNGVDYPLPNAINKQRNNECFGKIRSYKEDVNGTMGIPKWASVYDWPLIRFADIILSLAEVKYQQYDETGARALMHEIRLRSAKDAAETFPAKIGGVQYASAEDFANKLDNDYRKADFMDELMEERSREICGEGWRRFDLVRTNRLASTINNISITDSFWNTNLGNAEMMKSNFRKYKIWYPIPKREIELNTNLVQNYGYSGEEK